MLKTTTLEDFILQMNEQALQDELELTQMSVAADTMLFECAMLAPNTLQALREEVESTIDGKVNAMLGSLIKRIREFFHKIVDKIKEFLSKIKDRYHKLTFSDFNMETFTEYVEKKKITVSVDTNISVRIIDEISKMNTEIYRSNKTLVDILSDFVLHPEAVYDQEMKRSLKWLFTDINATEIGSKLGVGKTEKDILLTDAIKMITNATSASDILRDINSAEESAESALENLKDCLEKCNHTWEHVEKLRGEGRGKQEMRDFLKDANLAAHKMIDITQHNTTALIKMLATMDHMTSKFCECAKKVHMDIDNQ